MRHVLVVLVLVLGLSGCASGPERVTIGGMEAVSNSGTDTVERPWGTVQKFPELQKAEPPVTEDVAFTNDMIMHHRQALELSENVLAHAALDDRVSASARFIIQDQENEIGIMSAWLEAWRSSLGDLAGHSKHDRDTMPGMLPQSRVDGIAELDDAAAQVAFLVAMIEHHEGAVTMSTDYLPVQGNSFTRSTAQHVIREQTIEIGYMRNVIKDLCATDGPSTCPAE